MYFQSWFFRGHAIFVNGQISRNMSHLGFQDFFCWTFIPQTFHRKNLGNPDRSNLDIIGRFRKDHVDENTMIQSNSPPQPINISH